MSLRKNDARPSFPIVDQTAFKAPLGWRRRYVSDGRRTAGTLSATGFRFSQTAA